MSAEQYRFAVSTYVRFFRNVEGVPFAGKISEDDADDVNRNVEQVADALWGEEKYTKTYLKEGKDHDEIYWQDMPEDKAVNNGIKKAAIISPDGRSQILTNEGEHIIVEGMRSGLDIDSAYNSACAVVNGLSRRIPFAANDKSGFLTANPLCCGTGLKIAVLMHLTALEQPNNLPAFISLMSKLKDMGLILRPFCRDKNRVSGKMYYIMNAFTLGVTEEEIIAKVKDGVKLIIDAEEELRSKLIATQTQNVRDQVWRGLGVLATARILNYHDFMMSVSHIRMGVELGELDMELEDIDRYMSMGQSFYIKKYMARNGIDPEESEDYVRARIMREEFAPVLRSML